MRLSGGFMVTALLAAGFAFYLTGRDATSTVDAVAVAADGLRERDVVGRALDLQTADRMVTFMNGLLESPDTVGEHVEEVRMVADTAAAWAAEARPASRDLHIAVSLRSAAGELRAHALNPSPPHLLRARRFLDQARNSLEAIASGDDPPEPPLATDGLRDQMHNLEQAQREQRQQVDEALRR